MFAAKAAEHAVLLLLLHLIDLVNQQRCTAGALVKKAVPKGADAWHCHMAKARAGEPKIRKQASDGTGVAAQPR